MERSNRLVNADTHVLACLRHARLMGAGYLQRYTFRPRQL